jgi:anti-sigma regulatory factor (Ser/Thr protein kinase)
MAMTLSLRTRIAGLFVPLLLLSGLGGGLLLLGHYKQTLWGLEQQAGSVAVTLTRMIGAMPPPAPSVLSKIMEANQITALRVTDAKGLEQLAVGRFQAAPPPLTATGAVVTLPETLEGDQPVQVSIGLETGGTLSLEISTARAAAEVRRIRWIALGLLAVGIVAGLCAMLAVAGPITRRLRLLEQRMGLLPQGRLEGAAAISGIQEVEDLDEALRTMHSVLRARRNRTDRLSVENEQFRTVNDLIGTLTEATQPDIDGILIGRQVVCRRIGDDAGQILRLIQVGETGHLLLGNVQLADPLDRSLRAGAIGNLVTARLSQGASAEQALADIATGNDRLLLLSWGQGAATRKVEWRAGRLQSEDCADTDILGVGLLTGSGERLLRQYMERFTDVALDARAADLSTILRRRCVGAYALITNPGSTGGMNRGQPDMKEIASLDLFLDSHLDEIHRLATAFEEFCAKNNIPAQPLFQFNLCFDELLSNIIQHSLGNEAGHRIKISIRLSDIMLQVKITDDGPEFDPLQRPLVDIDADIDEREIGGLGIHMVRMVMDSVAYQRLDGQNHFRFGQQVANWKNNVTESA